MFTFTLYSSIIATSNKQMEINMFQEDGTFNEPVASFLVYGGMVGLFVVIVLTAAFSG